MKIILRKIESYENTEKQFQQMIFLLISFILWGIHVKWRLIYLQKR